MKFNPPVKRPPLNLLPPKLAKKPSGAIYIQDRLLQDDTSLDENYTSKISSPVYKPNNQRPHLFELLDQTKTKKLTQAILESNIPYDEKQFLLAAAQRHLVFNYKKIADYYAHAPAELQALIEDSALVIIDFADAIAKGYVKYSEEIANIYVKEHGKS